MDYETYRANYVVDPAPTPRFAFGGISGVALFVQDFEKAESFYTEVLGPPGYSEGAGTRSWLLGNAWLTLLKCGTGAPENVEVVVSMETPAEAERLQQAFIDAGATGEAPSDQLMFERVRYCPLVDPFGTNILIMCPL
jgi:catechol 2,3-dioxygenase-like lactoylglutathione lyase family enzyme